MKIVSTHENSTSSSTSEDVDYCPADVEHVSSSLSLFTNEYLEYMNHVLSQQPLESVLEWCYRSLPNLFQVTSFGSSGMVVIHALSKMNLKLPVIFLDTLYHFAETIDHAHEVGTKYGLKLYWYKCSSASTRDEFETKFNSKDMWISEPARFEYLTKVEPLERALSEHKVQSWITGRRRDQGGLRTDLKILEIDPSDGRIKVNPLAHWTRDEVWRYLRREGVPYNPLYDQSYTSIGDVVTTAKNTNTDGSERAGRFHQFDGTKTECGIHTRRRQQQQQKRNEHLVETS
jgi:phosphoadenosine phosphosulfate reductase